MHYCITNLPVYDSQYVLINNILSAILEKLRNLFCFVQAQLVVDWLECSAKDSLEQTICIDFFSTPILSCLVAILTSIQNKRGYSYWYFVEILFPLISQLSFDYNCFILKGEQFEVLFANYSKCLIYFVPDLLGICAYF